MPIFLVYSVNFCLASAFIHECTRDIDIAFPSLRLSVHHMLGLRQNG